MDTIERGKSALVDIVEHSRRAKELKGYAGIGNGAGGYTTYVSYQPGKVYARIVDGVESSITVAIPQGVSLDPAVMVELDSVDGQLVIRRPDANDAARLYGDSAPITTVPPQPQTGYPAPTEPGELTLYGVNNALLGGLIVRITAYTHHGGRWDGVNTITLTPTATTGMRAWVLVGINRLTNALTQALAEDRSVGFNPMQISDCDAIIAANPDVDWRAAIDLTYSATGIDPAKIAKLTGRSEMRPKSNYSATAAPGVGDDRDDGYGVGSVWIDTTNDNVYQCTDSAVGTANWELLNGSTFSGDAFDVPYSATTSGDWSSAPADVGEALDTLAADVAAVVSGGGMVHTYVGYNTVGGSNTAMLGGTVYMKKITLAAAGFLASIGVYIDHTSPANNVQNLGCWVMSDDAGTPDLQIAIGAHRNSATFFTNSTARWLDMSIGIYLPAGDYWLCVQRGVDAGSDLRIYYDGSGSDKTQAIGNNWSADGNQYTITTTSDKYSIRGSVLR